MVTVSYEYVELEQRHRRIFTNLVAVNCHAGWKPLIDDLCHGLQRISDDTGTQIEATQVYTKKGILDFSFKPNLGEASVLVNLAQTISGMTCDQCGHAGRLVNYRTRCADHEDFYDF